MDHETIGNRRHQSGFTLIELLIAIVVVGVLTAVAIVGIGGLTDNGKAASCQATIDSARAAVAVHYANHSGTYPTAIADMTGTNPPELQVPSSVDAVGATLKANGWTITLGSNGVLTATGAANCS